MGDTYIQSSGKGKMRGQRKSEINTQSLQFTTFLLISPHNNYPIILCVKDSESDFIASMLLNVFNGAFLLVPHGTTDILTQ